MEPLIHFSVVFATLSMLRIKPRIAFPLSLLTLVPDLDVLFGIHKWLTHSVFVISAVGIPIVLFMKKTRWGNLALLSLLAVLSHPMLDAFSSYTPMLWPIYGESIWVKLGANLNIGDSFWISGGIDLLTKPTTFEHFSTLEAPLITGAGLLISAILVFQALLIATRSRK